MIKKQSRITFRIPIITIIIIIYICFFIFLFLLFLLFCLYFLFLQSIRKVGQNVHFSKTPVYRQKKTGAGPGVGSRKMNGRGLPPVPGEHPEPQKNGSWDRDSRKTPAGVPVPPGSSRKYKMVQKIGNRCRIS
jgi:hypothetical protein